MIHSFQTSLRTPRLAQNTWESELICSTSPPPPNPKNPQLNCKPNTGHIYKVKNDPGSYYLQLSDEPKHSQIDPEYLEKQTNLFHPSSCTKTKNSQLNCKANTGHINTVKYALERYNFQLSDEPKNT